MPVAQPEERVGAHQAKQRALGREPGAQALQRVDGVIGAKFVLSRGLGRVGKRNLEARLARNGQPRHGQPLLKAGGRSFGLERLHAHRGKQHRIQPERGARRARHGQVTKMGRVETSAEEGHARSAPPSLLAGLKRVSAVRLVHCFIVPRPRRATAGWDAPRGGGSSIG